MNEGIECFYSLVQESFSGSITFTVTGSTEPTKLTHVTAALSVLVPSTEMVNLGGGDK